MFPKASKGPGNNAIFPRFSRSGRKCSLKCSVNSHHLAKGKEREWNHPGESLGSASMATATFKLPIFYLISYHVVTYLLFNGSQIVSNGALDSSSEAVISKERVMPSKLIVLVFFSASFHYKIYSSQPRSRRCCSNG